MLVQIRNERRPTAIGEIGEYLALVWFVVLEVLVALDISLLRHFVFHVIGIADEVPVVQELMSHKKDLFRQLVWNGSLLWVWV